MHKPVTTHPEHSTTELPTVEPAIMYDVADTAASTPAPKPARLEPTRYGDWELNGKCVDF